MNIYLTDLNICVIMFYDDNIKVYGDICYNLNKLYCQKYNLDIIRSSQRKYKHRKPHWERIPLLLKYLPNYDYLIYIDSDAFFYYDADDIKKIINANINYNLIFSNDKGNKNINTGFFIVKNTEYSKEFLTKWGYCNKIYEYVQKRKRWNDQEGVIYMINKNILNINNNHTKYKYGILQHFNLDLNNKKTFVCHLAGSGKGKNTDIRYNICNQYFKYLVEKIPLEKIDIGSSRKKNTKVIKLDKKYTSDTELKFNHKYKDKFSYLFDDDNNLTITRIDEKQGWGQSLVAYI